MTTIVYLNKKPFYCFNIKNYCEGNNIRTINERWGKLTVTQQIEKNNTLHLNCETLLDIDRNDIVLNMNYKKMGDNEFKPVWVKNDQGKQITFLTEDEIPDMKICINCLKVFPLNHQGNCDECNSTDIEAF